MKKTPRLIDADIFKERLMANIGLTNCLDRSFKETPTIDAVEVVRCKDCKHRPIKEDADGENFGFNVIAPNSEERCPCLVEDGWYSWMPDDNFYCGFGERTDHEQMD